MVERGVVDGETGVGADSEPQPELGISAHRSSPDRIVLVETGNSDGWIAFDADAAAPIDG